MNGMDAAAQNRQSQQNIDYFVNSTTLSIKPYPMEELARIRQELRNRGLKVYDFGTGDPKLNTWDPIPSALKNGVPKISQYPSIQGTAALRKSHETYLTKRFGITDFNRVAILPTGGSKEGLFHIALSMVGRNGGRKRILYPNPCYPVYKSSTEFANGIPTPVELLEKDNFLLKPWNLPRHIIQDTAALWINYPHNPTAAVATPEYLEEVYDWCQKNSVVLLSDECYVDIYDEPTAVLPPSVLNAGVNGVVTFMSLSKRSGMTGYRSGFMAGDPHILTPIKQARANFGVATPECIQEAACVAWQDEEHVRERRKIFSKLLAIASKELMELKLLKEKPSATFYLWCKVPPTYGQDDIGFAKNLAQKGVIITPSSWLSEGVTGYFRMALVENAEDTVEALKILRNFVLG